MDMHKRERESERLCVCVRERERSDKVEMQNGERMRSKRGSEKRERECV